MPGHTFGWVPDLPDQRDFLYAAPVENMAALPTSVDLRPQCPKTVYDQGQLGSCTANAIAGALEFDRLKEGLADFIPSRLFIYYNERVMEGTVGTDSGAQIRDGIKSVGSIGAPPESDWPYNIAEFAVKPSPKAYKDAPLDKAPTRRAGARTDEGLSGVGLSVRLRIYCVYKLRKPTGGADGHRAHAGRGRKSVGGPCGAGCGI